MQQLTPFLAEPLLQKGVHRYTCLNVKFLTILTVLTSLVLVVQLSPLPYSSGGGVKYLRADVPTIRMADEPSQTVEAPAPDTVMTVGKHRGRTFADLKENEPDYCGWVIKQDEPSEIMKDFVKYLNAQGVTEATLNAASNSGGPGATGPDAVLTVGKHKGRTFADLKANEPDYCAWAMRQEEPTDSMKSFTDYLMAEGLSGVASRKATDQTQSGQDASGPDAVMTVGMHKGRTFADLKMNEPDYVNWVLRQEEPSEVMKSFTDYLKAEGITVAQSSSSEIPPAAPETVMNIGKHKGRTFVDLKEKEPEYVSWALKQEEPSNIMKAFTDYLKAEGVTSAQPTTGELPLAAPDSVMTVGKHKGRTFKDLKENELEYVNWALRQEEPSEVMKAFADYLKAEGVTAAPQTTGEIPPAAPDTVMNVGKHKGRTFADLKENEPDYVNWALKQEEPGEVMKAFSDYLKAEGVTTAQPTAAEPPPAAPDTMMNVGKHKGRTFADLKENEPEYVNWALKQEEPSEVMKAFSDYLKAEGVTTAQPTAVELPPAAPETVMNIGKHKGRTFADLKEHEPEYVNWALKQEEPAEIMKVFAEYLKAEGVTTAPPTASELPPAAPDSVMNVGKHKGRTFLDLKEHEPEYVSWALKQEEPAEAIKAFTDYLRAEGVTAVQLAAGELPNAAPDTVMNVGKYKGRNFADLKNETEYVNWAFRQEEPTDFIKAFVDYLKAEGVKPGLLGKRSAEGPLLASEPDTVFPFGKFKGRTFADVKASEPDYVSWTLKAAEPSDELKAFQNYLHAEGVNLSEHSPAAQATGADVVMLVGKHKGRTFADLKATEPEYVAWALKQEEPTEQMKAFVDYLKAENAQSGPHTVMTMGRHIGRTFEDLRTNEKEYASWILKQENLKDSMRSFSVYLQAEGVGEPVNSA